MSQPSITPDDLNEVQGPDDEYCEQCGGDGTIMLSEAGPSVWGEDCFCEEDRVIACPLCRGTGEAQ